MADDEDPRLEALERRLQDLSTGFEDFRKAQTPAEKRAATEDIEDAEDQIERLAKQAGVHPDAIRQARKDAEYARLKPHIERYLAEAPAPDKPEETPPPADKDGEKGKKSKAEKEKTPPSDTDPPEQAPSPADPPPEDSGPTHPHWSERGIGELIR